MNVRRSLRIARLRVEIKLLQKQHRRLQSIISLKLAGPGIKRQAQVKLGPLLTKITAKTDELTRMENES